MDSKLVVDIQKDLNWIYQAPPLMLAPIGIAELFTPSAPASVKLAQNTLLKLPAPPRYRLGKQFEETVSLLLNNNPLCASLIARNTPITVNKQTLGELDFLYRDNRGDVVHLEVAIKFYLFTAPYNGLSSFIGPGGRDRLDKKWQRLTEHQLQLSHQTIVQNYLIEHHIPVPTKQELLLTGYLFYPIGFSDTCALPHEINPKHLKGWWCYPNQLHQLDTDEDVRFYILPRYHWIAGILHQTSDDSMSFKELAYRVEDLNLPCMIAVTRMDATGVRKEESRGFIVPDNWPKR